eukprot:CAMPEP_0203753544 /NCGR_PEP_ID=MMETSP0098-20131031/7298_1 /ASSEMBLY_ACC=CAM_ASM_000208 /TAXON_ID=96639 /ORGANISM=" , Strain NY0313808BC1" /LENGTH=1723 /DNA_ID=CAMNT_0050644191 /DNA_START=914 /DNA_END=6081 /DNA_ORIENTATION=-
MNGVPEMGEDVLEQNKENGNEMEQANENGQVAEHVESEDVDEDDRLEKRSEQIGETIASICGELDMFAGGDLLAKPGILQKINQLVKVLQGVATDGEIKSHLELDYVVLIRHVRPLLTATDTLVRASCFRLIRHFLLEIEAMDAFLYLRIHIFVTRSLECEQRHVLERMEALKLCRRIMTLECSMLPRGIVRSLVAIANHSEDPFRNVVLETLRQLAIRDITVVAQCGGIRSMVNAIIDPSLPEMSKTLVLCLTHLLGQEETRKYVRPSLDLNTILSPLTDAERADTAEGKRRWKSCQNALILFLKSWTGLMVFASDPMGLRSLVEMLVQPVSLELRTMILQTIFLIFLHISPYNITVPKPVKRKNMKQTNGRSRQSGKGPVVVQPPEVEYWGIGPNAVGARALTAFGYSSEYFPVAQTQPHTAMNQFLATALLAFAHCGLVDALLEIVVTENPPLSETAAQLLGVLMRLSEALFSESRHWRLFNFSQLVEKATRFEKLHSANPSEKLTARRAASIIQLISSITGAGLDAVVSTIRTCYTYVDASSLCSQLSIPAACLSEYECQNIGVFPRGEIASLPYTPRLVASILLENTLGSLSSGGTNVLASPIYRAASVSRRRQNSTGSSPLLKRSSKIISSLRSPSALLSKRKQAEKKMFSDTDQQQTIHERMGEEYLQNESQGLGDVAGRALEKSLRNKNDTRPNWVYANRGHRRQVRTKLLTELAYQDIDNMNALVYKTNVLQGKDWTSWEWNCIDEVVTGPLRNRGLCVELMKSKFLKRILGFFRATTVGEYIVLPYKPGYQTYTAVAVNVIHILLGMPEGLDFLRNDRRGKVHKQIVDALQLELNFDDATMASKGRESILMSSFFSVGGRIPSNPDAQPYITHSPRKSSVSNEKEAVANTGARIFSPIACVRSMARDLFSILGAYTTSDIGISLLEAQGFFNTLDELSRLPSKDYLTQLVISHLDMIQSEFCRSWLQSVLLHKRISTELNLFIIGYLRGHLRRGHTDVNPNFSRWIIEILLSQLGTGGSIATAVLSVFNEACHYPAYLEIIVSMNFSPFRPFLELHLARPLFFKLLSTHEGLRFLNDEGWAERLFVEWRTSQNVKYAARYETLMSMKLLCRHEPPSALPKCYRSFENLDSCEEGSDEVFSKTFGIDAAEEFAAKQLVSKRLGFYPAKIPLNVYEASAKAEPGFSATDLLSLMRNPWCIELWMKLGSGEIVYIPVHTSMDCSHLMGPEFGVDDLDSMTNEIGGDTTDGGPTPIFASNANDTYGYPCIKAVPCSPMFVLPEDATLYACLTLAGDPILRNGQAVPSPTGGGGFLRPRMVTPADQKRRDTDSTARSGSSGLDNMPPSQVSFTRTTTTSTAEYILDYQLTTRENFSMFDDETYWIKCGPEHMRFVDSGTGKHDAPRKFMVCPGSDATATFAFTQDERSKETQLKRVSFHIQLFPECPNAPYIPSHFFGELAKTLEGVNWIRSRGYMRELLTELLDLSRPVLLRRTTLWTLAHIGASETGLNALLDEGGKLVDNEGRRLDFVKVISDIATARDQIPLRGTAVTVLGLISRTEPGARLLHAYGWDTSRAENAPYGHIITRKSTSQFFRPIGKEESRRVWDGLNDHFQHLTPLDEEEEEKWLGVEGVPRKVVEKALQAVSNLSNRIAYKDAFSTLHRLRVKNGEIFSSPVFLLRVHAYLSNFHYELPVRQSILGLVHRRVQFSVEETWHAL